MLHKTRGIVLQVTDFRETSVVAKIYTELFGLQGFIVNSVRKKKAKVKQNILHPLSLVDLEVYHKDRKGLRRIADISPNPVLQNIPFDVRKSSIALFLDEVLCKVIQEEESNLMMFDFIFHAIRLLDMQTPVNSDFHLYFLIRLSQHLGFYPQIKKMGKAKNGKSGEMEGSSPSDFSGSEVPFFNLQEGLFQSAIPTHPYYIEPPLTETFLKLIQSSVDFSTPISIRIQEKRLLTEKILEYYRLHLPAFREIKSKKVLEEVWS